jgi:hypothetical protein
MKILVLCLLLLPSSLCAQKVEHKDQVPGSNVLIRNTESAAVSFGVSCDDKGSWLPATLEGGRSKLYECDDRSARMWVQINTDIEGTPHRESEVRVQNKGRYAIFFDPDRKQWDLKEM